MQTVITEVNDAATEDGGKVLIDWLRYCSYRANRSIGMTQAQLVSLGFDARYETLYAQEMARAA